MNNNPIGVFDSGVGGLTAMQELTRLLPREHIIYLGDSRNMPYGEKTREEIIDLARRNMEFLLARGVKTVFIACGSATVNAMEELKKSCPVPIIGVVEPAVREALALTENGRIGVLATRSSIAAETFQRALLEERPSLVVEARACPVFATMVEYGIFSREDKRVRRAAESYLPPLREAGVDTIILGCTHYPLLSEVIKEYTGLGVRLVSSGAAAARSLADEIVRAGLECGEDLHRCEFYTTGDAERFAASAVHMLGRDISSELTAIEPL